MKQKTGLKLFRWGGWILINERRFGVHQSGPQRRESPVTVGSPGSEPEKWRAPPLLCIAQLVRKQREEAGSQENILDHFFPLVNQRRVVMGARLT